MRMMTGRLSFAAFTLLAFTGPNTGLLARLLLIRLKPLIFVVRRSGIVKDKPFQFTRLVLLGLGRGEFSRVTTVRLGVDL